MIRRALGLTPSCKEHPQPDPHGDVADVAQPPRQKPRPVSLLHQPFDATLGGESPFDVSDARKAPRVATDGRR